MHGSRSIEPFNAIFAEPLVASLQQRNSRGPTTKSSTTSKDENVSLQLKRIERNVA